ncbi:MAG: AzlC family ABC transporter permease [Pseudomonadota bacterium]
MNTNVLGARNEYALSFQKASPIVAGYFAVSFVFGLTAVNQGLPVWVPVLMSLIVYAGAAQFTFLVLVVAQASMLTIVLTTFLINLRHMLMSVYMSDAFSQVDINKKQRLWYGFGLTDESFATHSLMLNDRYLGPHFLISFNTFCHTAWIVGTLLGAVAATIVNEVIPIKLDYALTAMMLYVLVSLINTRRKLIIALVSIISMCVLNFLYPSYLNIFIATAIGCFVATWNKTKSSS